MTVRFLTGPLAEPRKFADSPATTPHDTPAAAQQEDEARKPLLASLQERGVRFVDPSQFSPGCLQAIIDCIAADQQPAAPQQFADKARRFAHDTGRPMSPLKMQMLSASPVGLAALARMREQGRK